MIEIGSDFRIVESTGARSIRICSDAEAFFFSFPHTQVNNQSEVDDIYLPPTSYMDMNMDMDMRELHFT